jgi:hypothetical protein
MWDIIKNALSYFSSENDKPKSKGNPIKLTPLNLKEYAKQENQRLTAKQDATAFRSPTKPVSNYPANVAAALMAQRNNTKAQQEGEAKDKAKAEKEKYYNPKLKDITIKDPLLNTLYNNQWMMNVPILGNYIKSKAKEVAEYSQGGPFANISDMGNSSYKQGDPSIDSTKYTGLYTNDRNIPSMVDQYFSNKPLFEKSKYKPTSDYFTFLPSYSIKRDLDKKLTKDQNFKNNFIGSITEAFSQKGGDPEKLYQQFLKDKKPIYNQMDYTSGLNYLTETNLGGHKIGVAWDKEKNLPYISISDAWDFEPNNYTKKWGDSDENYVQAALLHKAGNPFKIYDRFYFDPKTQQYIPDAEVDKIKKSKINTDKPTIVDRDAIARRLGLAPKK